MDKFSKESNRLYFESNLDHPMGKTLNYTFSTECANRYQLHKNGISVSYCAIHRTPVFMYCNATCFRHENARKYWVYHI